jgi:hypothetical protein
MKKYTFKLVYIYENQLGRVITFSKLNRKTGMYDFINKKGKLYETAELDDNDHKNTLSWALVQSENIQGKPKATRCFLEKSFYLEEDEARMVDAELREVNKTNRIAYQFLKEHPEVLVKNGQGDNINEHIGTNILFELIEESQIENNQVEKNKKLAEGTRILTEMYEKNRERFLDFCYAYNIQVKGKTYEAIYNTAMTKLQFNPMSWEQTLKDSNYELLSKLRKALEEGMIEIKNEYMYFNNEAIGKTEEECIAYFNTNESPRKLLYGKVGYATTSSKAEVAETKETEVKKPLEFEAAKQRTINAKIFKVTKFKDEEQKKAELEKLKAEHPEEVTYIESKYAELSAK